MSNFNINLNLRALKNTVIVNVPGKTATKKCIAIPIEDNNLFVGEKNIYLNLAVWESDNLRDGKTHLVKQSFSKKIREAMTDEECRNAPILGDVKPFENTSRDVKPEATVVPNEDDDLPF
jgi:hypothetical protein